jgi:hypothetical protein
MPFLVTAGIVTSFSVSYLLREIEIFPPDQVWGQNDTLSVTLNAVKGIIFIEQCKRNPTL